MPLIPFKSNPTRRELRQFAGIWFPAFCLIVAAIIWRGAGSTTLAAIVAAAGLAIGAIGWLRPELIRPIFVAWMATAYPVGWVTGHALLAILYFAVLTPIGLVCRLAGRDSLNRQSDREAPTYWQPHREPADDASYFRQY